MRPPSLLRLVACCLLLVAVAGCREEGGIEVSRFTFHGTDAVSEGQLRSVLATGASSRIPWGTKRYFNRQQFEADLKRIVAFYRDRGFPEARVTDFDVELSRDQESVRIAITIDEGRPVVAERIVFEGFDVLPEEHRRTLERELPLQPEAPLDRALLQASRELALDEFRDHGYPYASVRLAEEPGLTDRHRIIVLRAEPGERAVHGPIEVVGNTSVDDRVIRRQLTFRPGMEFRQSRLRESQRMLYSQELFQFANIEVLREEEQSAEIATRVTVIEGDHRRLNLGVGYGTEERARGEVDWRHVNFFGGARTAGIRGRYSSLDRGIRLNFTEPYFFSPRMSLGLTGQSWHTSEPLYKLNANGGRATVTRQFARGGGPVMRLRPRMSLSLAYGLEFEEYEVVAAGLEEPDLRDRIIALGMDPRTGLGRGTRSFVSLDGGRNTTDNILDARRGYVASFHAEQAGSWLGGDFSYYEVTGEGRFYQNLADRAVFAMQARAGSIRAIGDREANIPFHKRYFLGGAGNLRGWGRFQVSPLSGAGLPIGGDTFFNSSVELRAPVWGQLSGVLFLDAGNVWDRPWSFDFGDLRYNIGPGVRYNTPVGPLRLDVGYQLNPIPGLQVRGEPEPRRWRVHFSIGQAF
jgi:outer membrane protein assembly complex protein YaeT